MDKLLDKPNILWVINKDKNDRIHESALKDKKIETSLYFIKPQSIVIRVETGWNDSKKVRAVFQYNGVKYDLSVTEPMYEKKYLNKNLGEYNLSKNTYICVSLGIPCPDDKYCYKLITSIIELD